MSFYGGFPEYVPVAERRKQAQKSMEQLKKKNPNIAPVIITGRRITRTWWGKSWCDNLERYSDYANRIGRGRSYVRNGAVVDLQMIQGKISALVQGSASKPYQVHIAIQPLSKDVWEAIIKNCAGKIDSLQELMEGKFPKALSDLFTAKGTGLFPAPKEITLQCSCPDSARMCKHVAAVLYGVGVRLDEDTALFFMLRNVNVEKLISETIIKKSHSLLEKSKARGRRVIDEADISGVFGIEIETETETGPVRHGQESDTKKLAGKRDRQAGN
ncbi:MAG TPA: SWIM zinc finger family protein [Paenibacillus sp.]|uniref:SWIM zinc finger family protein n=1 Tax=Paenibacillus sp. TaxID=58172 RepID=UPI002BB67FB9|nr:SWIM zinc finger family protein [Paenibacillus sp.]HUC93269.1 SWIM zinc finger family protein [Paenibacillus sp.]